jgi:nicotinate-nucleotide pyrophosphorylase (carboxylating)
VNERTRSALIRAGLDPSEIQHLVHLALDEDLRYGPDVTSDATVPDGLEACGDIVAREHGVICGVPTALAVLDAVGLAPKCVTTLRDDGETIEPGEVVLRIAGPLRQLLLAERTMLNFMTHLSGIASATKSWVDALEGTNCRVRDTRKTTPGLRQLEKYAVRCGGGTNHRMGLGDAALIKDNHVVATGGITQAVAAVRAANADVDLEVECDTLEQVREAVAVGCSLVLLDNMTVEELREAVAIARRATGVRLEASGSMSLSTARAVAATGVDFIAVGSLTHSSLALDLGFDLTPFEFENDSPT